MRGATLVALLAVGVLLSSAAEARPGALRPDRHDRALIVRLGAKVTTFRALAEKRSDGRDLQASLDKCIEFKKDPSQAFAAVFALLPVLLIDVVNQYEPQLTDLHSTLAGMRADEPLFDQWLRAQAGTFSSILELNNHGKKIDYCKAASVMLDKRWTAQEVRSVLGVDPAVIAKLFTTSATPASAALKRLNLKMRPFFVSAGLSAKIANALTT